MSIYKVSNPYLENIYSFRSLKEAQKKVKQIFDETNLVCEIKPIYFARTVKGEIVNVDKNKKIGDWSIIT